MVSRRRRSTTDEPAPARGSSTRDEVQLRYVNHMEPGISRIRAGEGFQYLDPDGRPIQDLQVLERIRSLAIPPAWVNVWICADPHGHLQAVGRDARGRLQYRYHPGWRASRDATKFDGLLDVAQVLPLLRRRLDQDLDLPGLPSTKVLAALVWLLQTTLIRIGNEEYARDNQSFGLTTLQDMHAKIEGLDVRFEFRGKAGKHHVVTIRDPRVTHIVARCQELPGQELFQYLDPSGERHDVDSEHVNTYLHELGGPGFSAKDFRTWIATVRALEYLRESGPPRSPAAGRSIVTRCMRTIAGLLGNTPAIARESYVHPGLIIRYLSGELHGMVLEPAGWDRAGLSLPERATVAFLQILARRGHQEQPGEQDRPSSTLSPGTEEEAG